MLTKNVNISSPGIFFFLCYTCSLLPQLVPLLVLRRITEHETTALSKLRWPVLTCSKPRQCVARYSVSGTDRIVFVT